MTIAFVQLGLMCCDIRYGASENASYYLFKNNPLALKIYYEADEVHFRCIKSEDFFSALGRAKRELKPEAWYPVHMDPSFLVSFREVAAHQCVELVFYLKGEQLIFKAISSDLRPHELTIENPVVGDLYSLPCTARQTVAFYCCQ